MSSAQLIVGGAGIYVGLFVLVQTLRQWKRLGHSPITSMTSKDRPLIRRLVEDAIGLGLLSWVVFVVLFIWNEGWWRSLPHLEAWPDVRHVAGASSLLISCLLVTAGNLTLGLSWRMGIADEPQELIDHGIFRHVRHPINGGMICYFLGLALMTPNLLTVPLMVLAAFAVRCETALEEDFWLACRPREYGELMCRTGRYFPRLPWLGRAASGASRES